MPEAVLDQRSIRNQREALEYNRDVIQKHSLASQKMIDLTINHIDRAFEAGKSGKNVVWSGAPCPAVLYASDVIPLLPTDLARFGNPEINIPVAENYFQIPSESCAMIKAIMGGLYKFKDSPCKKIITTGLCCEPELVSFNSMTNHGYELYVMDVYQRPTGASEERVEIMRNLYRKEFNEISIFASGKTIDKDRLKEEIIRANRVRLKFQKLAELDAEHNSYLGALIQVIMRRGMDMYYGQPEEFESIIDEMIDELAALPEGAYCQDKVKLMWCGGTGVDFSVFNLVDELGAYVKGWNTGNFKKLYREDIDPLESCVEFAIGDEFAMNIQESCENFINRFQEMKVDGIILYSSLGCTILTMNNEISRRYFSERNIPTLVLTGTAEIAGGQTITRLKAFIEMLS